MSEEGERSREKMSSLIFRRGGTDHIAPKFSPPVSQSVSSQAMHNRKDTDKSEEQDLPVDFSRNPNRQNSRDFDNSEFNTITSASPEHRSSPIAGHLDPKDEPVSLRPLEKPKQSYHVGKIPIPAELKPILDTTEHEPYFHHGRFPQHHAAFEGQTMNPWIMQNAINFDRNKIVSASQTVTYGTTNPCQRVGSFDNPPKALEKSHIAFTINSHCKQPEVSQIGESSGCRPHYKNPLFPNAIFEHPRSDSHTKNDGMSPLFSLSSASPRSLEEESQQSRKKLIDPQPAEILHHTVDGKYSDPSKWFNSYPNAAPDGPVYSHPNLINSALNNFATMFPHAQPPMMSFSAFQNVLLSMRPSMMPELNSAKELPETTSGHKKRPFQIMKHNEIARLLGIPEITPRVTSTDGASNFTQTLHTRGILAESSSENEDLESDIAPDSQGRSTGQSGSTFELCTLPPEVSGQGNRKYNKLPDEMKEKAYYEKRRKNNAAVKRCRDARRQREDQLAFMAQQAFAKYAEVKAELNKLQGINLALLEENNQLKRQLFARSVSGIDCNPRLSPSPKINENEDQWN